MGRGSAMQAPRTPLAILLAVVAIAGAVAIGANPPVTAAPTVSTTVVNLAVGDTALVTCAAQPIIVPEDGRIVVGCNPVPGAPTDTATATSRPTTTTTTPSATTTATAAPSTTPGRPAMGILLAGADIRALSITSTGWKAVKAAADAAWGSPNLSDLNNKHDVYTLAGALAYARTGDGGYRAKTAAAILAAIGTEDASRALEISRNIQSYVFAADLINLREYDAAGDQRFRSWLASVRSQSFDGMSIVQSSEKRPNNWGTHAMAARVAIARYLGDSADLARAAAVFKGWLGDRSSYAGYSYGDLSWQADPSKPVGINPKGAVKNGHNVDGVLPDDQRRAGSYTWPPPCENYVHEALQGALVAAWQLSRAGYDVWGWQDRALLRAYQWLYTVDKCPASGDDGGYPWLINRAYGTTFAGASPAPMGKNLGFQDWLFGGK